MSTRRFRWGPAAALAGLFGVAIWPFLQGAIGPRDVPPQPPVASGPPLPLVPPPTVRPEAPPPARAPDLADVSVQPNGSLTASGIVDAGARVAIVANGVTVAEGDANGEGRWLIGPTPPLAGGTTEVRVRSTLPDGRSATSAETLVIVVPRSTAEAFTATLNAPGAAPREIARVDPRPVVVPDFEAVRLGRDGVVALTGRADPGARVALVAGGRDFATATADAAGAVTLGPTPALTPGEHRLQLRSTHADGRAATSPDTLVATIPMLPGGAFSVVRERPGEPSRVIAEEAAVPARAPRFERATAAPDGSLRVTGVVDPNARVELLSGDRAIGEAQSGPGGSFALGPNDALPTGRSELALRSTLADGRSATSADRLIVERPNGGSREPFRVIRRVPGEADQVLLTVEPPPPPPPAVVQAPPPPPPAPPVVVQAPTPPPAPPAMVQAPPPSPPPPAVVQAPPPPPPPPAVVQAPPPPPPAPPVVVQAPPPPPPAPPVVVQAPPPPPPVPPVVAQAPPPAPVVPAPRPVAAPTVTTVSIGEDGAVLVAARADAGNRVGAFADGALLVEQTAAPTGDAVLLLGPDLFQAGDNALTLRARAPDGRAMNAEERLIVTVPRGAGEAFIVSLVRSGEAPREVARRAPRPVALVAPPQPAAPLAVASPPPSARASVPPPRRPIPESEVK